MRSPSRPSFHRKVSKWIVRRAAWILEQRVEERAVLENLHRVTADRHAEHAGDRRNQLLRGASDGEL
jgi:hypothetical protein